MITIAPGAAADFDNLNLFVAAAVADAFYRPDLTEEQTAENARIISIAERTARETLTQPHRAIFVARENGILAGFVIVDWKDEAMPEIDWLIVGREWQGSQSANFERLSLQPRKDGK
jgi:hypothetical protein